MEVLVYVRELHSVVLIEQQRFPMETRSNPDGVVTECVAGRFDARLSVRELAAQEVFEEIGVSIKPERITVLNGGRPLALSPGILTEKMYIAFAEVSARECKSSRRLFGNRREGERIKRKLVPVPQLSSTVFDNMTTFALIQWFLNTMQA